ncbi:MAG: tRNA 4-thiouridine(8) synthase ThiI [Clostridia bacterium]|nr:tRNA 4-thiouridine(8) synthase ThiI [Clostridia bacterium]
MKEIILIKNGELALKGLNRNTFEDALIKNLKTALADIMDCEITRSQSTIMITPTEEYPDMDAASEAISKVFGIAAYSRAVAAPKEMQKIVEVAGEYLKPQLAEVKTFKVEAKRSDKHFPLKSPEISRELGGYLLKNNTHLKVDVHNPDLTVTVEVRDQYAFIHGTQLKGAGGMPVGTAGRASILISGGIDSPVAAWMMAKRGLVLNGIHFASPPYTSDRAEQKVHKLMSEVAEYAGRMDLYVVPFTEIQERIKDDCPEEMFTIIMRRMMMRISERVARQHKCGALITGESLGQVASQTLAAIQCTNAVANLPVFRPLIGMDKNEIVEISRRIGTFETSIEPYEDCCTVFTPRHPRLKPTLEAIEEAEAALNVDELVKRAADGVRLVKITPNM